MLAILQKLIYEYIFQLFYIHHELLKLFTCCILACDRIVVRPKHITNLILVHLLVAVLLALVRAHQKLQLVLLQEVVRDVRPKVSARTAQPVRLAALVVLRIAPQNVKHLRGVFVVFI